MRLIAITPPDFRTDEGQAICRLLDRGWYRVHIRKPEASPEQTAALLRDIPEAYYQSISLHDHFSLAADFGLGGVHLNARNPGPPAGWRGMVSRSCHSLDEAARYACLDYLTLSPVFDSISKPGYRSGFTADQLRDADLRNVYALGGVTFVRLGMIEQLGFEGAAMLSEAWRPRMEFLQYITHTDAGLEDVLRGGCRWVQLRMKDVPDDELSAIALRMKAICRRYGATFILDDRADLVRGLGADGVHLGKNDMPVSEARQLLGPAAIIGATANTEYDIIAARDAGADYIGLGPFRFTTTKKGLSPLLGAEGYTRIMNFCRSRAIDIPVVAIGGIMTDDLPTLRTTGVDGIAVSGLIQKAFDKQSITKDIIRIWKNS